MPDFNVNEPNPTPIWDCRLGGKDNFTADRAAAERITEVMPAMPVIARFTRRFHVDVVYRLVTACGIRQFLDVGGGLPTADNTHEVAQRAGRRHGLPALIVLCEAISVAVI